MRLEGEHPRCIGGLDDEEGFEMRDGRGGCAEDAVFVAAEISVANKKTQMFSYLLNPE